MFGNLYTTSTSNISSSFHNTLLYIYVYSLISTQSQQKASNNSKSICVYKPKQHRLFNLASSSPFQPSRRSVLIGLTGNGPKCQLKGSRHDISTNRNLSMGWAPLLTHHHTYCASLVCFKLNATSSGCNFIRSQNSLNC